MILKGESRISAPSPDVAGPRDAGVIVGNQRGIALIVVMVTLLLLSVLGMTVLSSTTTDLRIAGNAKNGDNAFYVADSAMEFAQSNAAIYSALLPAPAAVWPAANAGKILNDDGTTGAANTAYPDYHQIKIYKDAAKTQEEGTANVKVNYVGTGPVPTGLGTEVDAGIGGGTGFQANFYVVSVIADAANSSRAEIESHVARIVPK